MKTAYYLSCLFLFQHPFFYIKYAFQIAGGIVVFLFALTMIFGESKPEEELKMVKDLNETAIFPIATPSIASPGAMLAAVILTENSEYGILEQLYSTFLIIASNYALLKLQTDQINSLEIVFINR